MAKILISDIVLPPGVPGPPGAPGAPGEPGPPGPNTVPTNEAIATALTTDGPAKTALSDGVNAIGDQRFVQTLNATSSAELDAAIATVAAGAFPRSIRVPHGAHIVRTTGVNISTPNLRHLTIDGKVEFQADVIGFTRFGAPGAATQKTCSPITAGDRTITVNGVSGLAVGDRVFIIANDTVPNSGDKVGYMREITTISGLNVGIDAAIPRSISSSVRLKQLALAPSICFDGDGEVFYDNPETYTSAMFSFKYAEDVTFKDPLLLRDGGGPCIVLGHVNGFRSTATIDRFIDDAVGGHFGYGVSAGGASRNGYVGGRISRCRHAFTTNAGPEDATFNFYGEPDNWIVEPLTYACKDKALDTHRVGWGITLRLNDSGSGGGVHVRADNCTVEGRSDGAKIGAGVWVESVVTVPATIGAMHFSNHEGDGIKLDGPAKLAAFPTCINIVGAPFLVAAGVAYTIGDTARVIKAADQSVASSTTPVDATDMVLPVDANAVYEISGYFITNASQAGDITFSWTAPSGATMTWSIDGLSTGATSTGGSVGRNDGSVGSSLSVGGVGGSTTSVARPWGFLTTGATGGTLQLRFTQLVADAANSTLKAKSRLSLRRVG